MKVFGSLRLACAVLLMLVAGGARAGFAEIRAEFRPDPSNPMVNRFKNVTPSTGYCQHFAYYCDPRGWFSLFLPITGVPQTTGGPVPAKHADPRQGAYFKVPSHWQAITVTNEQGDSVELELRISGIGGNARHGGDVQVITGGGDYSHLWSTGRWHNAPAPCLPSGGLNGSSFHVVWFWLVPENAGVCATQAQFDLPHFLYMWLLFGYELRTPNPLSMPAGIYRGSKTYTMGPGMDFDFAIGFYPMRISLRWILSWTSTTSSKSKSPPAATVSSSNPRAAGRPGCKMAANRRASPVTRPSTCGPARRSR